MEAEASMEAETSKPERKSIMIIYNNDKEMKSNYVSENKILEVNSPLSIEEIIEALRKDEDILEKVVINQFKYIPYADFNGTLEFKGLTTDNPAVAKKKTGSYSNVLTADEYNDYEESGARYVRPQEIMEFEKYRFNQPTNFIFTPVEEPIDKKELLHELMAAYGVLPTLWDENDLSLQELKTLSNAGEHLFRPYPVNPAIGAIALDNPIPTRSLIETYQGFSDYEKRIVNSGRIHPRRIFDIMRLIKMKPDPKDEKNMVMTQRLINAELLEYMEDYADKHSDKPCEPIQTVAQRFKDPQISEDLLLRAEEIFKAKFKGHAPKVLKEYMIGQIKLRNLDPDNMPEIDIEQIADEFNQKNVAKVAKYQSPVLLGLDGILKFGEYRDAILQCLGITLTLDDAEDMMHKDFFPWLDAHKDINPSDLVRIIELQDKIPEFDVKSSPAQIIRLAENERGYRDCIRYEQSSLYSVNSEPFDFSKNEIAIKGRHTVAKQGDLIMRILPADDFANFTVGYDTHCCQHYGNAGETCVWKYCSDPFAAAAVVEKKGKVVAQGFIFTDEAKKTLVFDNIEFANDRDVKDYLDIICAWSEAMPYDNVHMGVGYNTIGNGIGKPIKTMAAMPTTLSNKSVYTDYHKDARALKIDGRLAENITIRSHVDIETKPDEPTKWDELASPDFAFMLNDFHKTPQERIDAAQAFKDNPTPELQMSVIASCPQIVLSLDNPCEEAQRWIMNNKPDLMPEIKNPIVDVQYAMLEKDPYFLKNTPNVSEEIKIKAMEHDGLMLEYIKDPSPQVIEAAVKQTGYAFRYIPEDKMEDRYIEMAVHTTPRVASLMNRVTPVMVNTVIRRDIDTFPLLKQTTETENISAVERKPSLINIINNPTQPVVAAAVRRNGMMIRNFQHQYPELRELALCQTGWAIRCLKHPTVDEVRLALETTPECITAIKDTSLLEELGYLPRTNTGRIDGVESVEPEII